jgi:hypothetical protein
LAVFCTVELEGIVDTTIELQRISSMQTVELQTVKFYRIVTCTAVELQAKQ